MRLDFFIADPVTTLIKICLITGVYIFHFAPPPGGGVIIWAFNGFLGKKLRKKEKRGKGREKGRGKGKGGREKEKGGREKEKGGRNGKRERKRGKREGKGGVGMKKRRKKRKICKTFQVWPFIAILCFPPLKI